MKYLGLIWASLWRKPVGSFLTVMSIFVAFLLFGLLRSVAAGFDSASEIAGVDRLMVSPRYSIIDSLPLSYIPRLRSVAGVEKISHQTWFGGSYQDNRVFFARWPVPPKEYMEIYDDYVLTDEELQNFINVRTSAIAGRNVADQLGWKVGDKIPFVPDIWMNKDGGAWEFDLVGIYDGKDEDTDTNQFFINFEFFDEYRVADSGNVSNFVVTIDNPDNAAAIAKQIDDMFRNSSDETKTATEQAYMASFANQIGDIGFMMTAILSAVCFSILLLTGNTMAQGIRERIPELAILKTVGFSNTAVLMIVLAESTLMTVLGSAAGLAAAYFMMPIMGSIPFFTGLELTMQVVGTCLAVAVALGLIVGILPAIRGTRLNIVDALAGR